MAVKDVHILKVILKTSCNYKLCLKNISRLFIKIIFVTQLAKYHKYNTNFSKYLIKIQRS